MINVNSPSQSIWNSLLNESRGAEDLKDFQPNTAQSRL